MTERVKVLITRSDSSRFSLDWCAPSEPQAPVFVLVPAMGVQARFYRSFAAALAATGCGVAVVEQRGHEETDRTVPGRRLDFGYAELADDLDAAVDLARARAPGTPLVVVGHSLGAHVACVSVARRPGTVDALVFVAAGSVHWRLWPRRFLALTQAFVALAALVGHFPGQRLGFAGREARGVMRDWGRLARTGRLTYGRPPTDAGRALAGLELPVLVVSIEGDTLAPQPAVDGLAALLPSARVTRRHVAVGTSTSPHFGWARHHESVVAAMSNWSSEWLRSTPH
jgi:predicted alpha/beta hydrolase